MRQDPGHALSGAYELAYAIAPELEQSPLYILPASEYPSLQGTCLGFAMSGGAFSPFVRELLGERYIGPGPAITIDLDRIAECALNFELAVRAVLVHELGHVLPSEPMLPGVIDTPEVRKIHARIFELEMSPEFRRWGSLDPDHDLTFIRRCAHLCARAEQKGYKLLFRDVVTGGVMPFLAWKRYFEILAGEAASMSRASFAEIEKMPVPAELERLWRDDVEYHSRIGTGRTYE